MPTFRELWPVRRRLVRVLLSAAPLAREPSMRSLRMQLVVLAAAAADANRFPGDGLGDHGLGLLRASEMPRRIIVLLPSPESATAAHRS